MSDADAVCVCVCVYTLLNSDVGYFGVSNV